MLLEAGEQEQAIANYERMLTMQVQLTGLDSHQTYLCHRRLGHAHFQNRNYSLATTHASIAKYILETIAGEGHPEMGSLYKLLGYAIKDWADTTVRASGSAVSAVAIAAPSSGESNTPSMDPALPVTAVEAVLKCYAEAAKVRRHLKKKLYTTLIF